jgi:hypothetical protein
MCQTSFGNRRFGGDALGDAGLCCAAAHAPAQLTRDTGGASSRYRLSCRHRWLMWDGRRIVEVADVGDHRGSAPSARNLACQEAGRAGAGDQNPLASGYDAPAGSPDPNPDLVTRTVEVVLLLPAAVGPLLRLGVSPPQSTAAPAEPTQFGPCERYC